jgi:hypothetical protein
MPRIPSRGKRRDRKVALRPLACQQGEPQGCAQNHDPQADRQKWDTLCRAARGRRQGSRWGGGIGLRRRFERADEPIPAARDRLDIPGDIRRSERRRLTAAFKPQ